MNVWINACQNKALISQFHLIQYCDHHCARCLRIQVYSCNVNYVAFVPVLNCLSSGPVALCSADRKGERYLFFKEEAKGQISKGCPLSAFPFLLQALLCLHMLFSHSFSSVLRHSSIHQRPAGSRKFLHPTSLPTCRSQLNGCGMPKPLNRLVLCAVQM